MPTVTYPLRLNDDLYKRVQAEAKRRHKKLADLFREVIAYGLDALPPNPESYEAVQAAWNSLGPAPEINHAAMNE